MKYTREQCLRLARRYVASSAFYRVLGDLQRAAGFLNSAHYWRERWQRYQGGPDE